MRRLGLCFLAFFAIAACSSSDGSNSTEPPVTEEDSGVGGEGGSGEGEGGAAGEATGGTAGAGPECEGKCGALEECFDNKFCVARKVQVPAGYSVDATEVTRSQYEAWLATSPSTAGQPSICGDNTDFAPATAGQSNGCTADIWPPASKGAHPVVCVDFCDAMAYCKGVGKRLCGKIGGGENNYDDYASVSKSQWFNACTSGAKNDFAYGDTLSEQTCNGGDNAKTGGSSGTTVPVGSLAGCQSKEPGYAGIYDMSGNVWEWEDSWEYGGASQSAHARGGSFLSYYQVTRCDEGMGYKTNAVARDLGFRCCTD